MARTFITQKTQIGSSDIFDDTRLPGLTMETTGSNIEEDLNNIRSQINRLLLSGSGNWYDDLLVVNGKQRGVGDLNTDLNDLEEKPFICPVQVLTDVLVPASSSFVTLSFANNQMPTNTIASGSGLGTIVAELPADVGTPSLELISGSNALTPLNIVKVRSATTKDAFVVSGSDVKGLLQVENGGLVQGDSFNDTDRQAQITFVYVPSGTDQYAVVPTDAIGGQVIEYIYPNRVTLDTLPEDCVFPNGQFIDMGIPAGQIVNLESAIDNQVGSVSQDQDIDIIISNSFSWAFLSGSIDLWAVKNNTTGGEIEINATLYDNNSVTNDFANGMTVDSSGTPILVGIDAGTIGTDSGADLIISASNDLFFDDGNQQGSTWAQTGGIRLSSNVLEWNKFEELFGEVSLLGAFISGSVSGSHSKAVGVVNTTAIPADDNVRGGVNINSSLLDYSGVDFVDDVNVYLNGQLLYNGANAAANNDVYPGDDATLGDLKFEFELVQDDVITMQVFGKSLS